MGTPCQDAHRIEVIHDLWVGVVADGAGSAKHAEIGAQLVTGETIAQIRTWSSGDKMEDEWQKHIQELIEVLREKLNSKAAEDGCALKDFAATFLLAIVTENRIVGAQIGDGAIVYGLQGEEPVRLLIEPERGEYLNETVFLTSDNYQEHHDTEREHDLSEFLQSPRVCNRTDDDKTFVFARRLPIMHQEIALNSEHKTVE